MVENSVDDYHLPSTHSTWLNYMANSGVKIERPQGRHGSAHARARRRSRQRPLHHRQHQFPRPSGRGLDSDLWRRRRSPRWRRSARSWSRVSVPSAPSASATPTAISIIFPNLVLNDGSSVTVRTFFPDGPGKMHVTAWALGSGRRKRKLRARAGSMRSSRSTVPEVLPRPTTSKRSNWCSRVSPTGRTIAGPRCRAAWAAKAISSTATSIICASSGASGTR